MKTGGGGARAFDYAGGGWIICVLTIGLVGCDRARDTVQSPRQVVEQIVRCRAERRYAELNNLIVPEQLNAVVSTLVALDDFLGANARLRTYVREQLGSVLAPLVDQSDLAEELEIFSRNVEFLDETIAADIAQVSFAVGGNLPVRQARLVRIGGTWRYDPGAGFRAELPNALHQMARGMDQTVAALRLKRLDPERLAHDPGPLLDEVRLRMAPGLSLLTGPATRPAR